MRLPSLSLIALSLLSASSYAVENGSPVDWQQYNDAVRLENQRVETALLQSRVTTRLPLGIARRNRN